MDFATVASLKQAEWIAVGSTATITGYYTPIDGLGFNAYIDNSGDTEDNVNIFAIGAGLKRAKRIVEGGNLVVQYGTVTTAQRIVNWTNLKAALAASNQICIKGELQVHVNSGEEFDITEDIVISGLGRDKSVLSVFPKRKASHGERQLFNHNGKNVLIEDLKFEGYDNRWLYETYDAELQFGANLNQAQITGTIRPNFWTELTIGDTLYYQEDNLSPGTEIIVQSFNSGTGTIDFTGNFPNAANTSMQTYIGRAWEEEASQADIDLYSLTWNTYNVDDLVFLNSQTQSDRSSIVINNCEFFGFDTNFRGVATDTKLFFNNCKAQANALGVIWSGAVTTYLSELILNNCEWYDHATICNASINPSGIVGSNDRFGGGIYLHPGIIITCNRVLFHSNNSTTVRNFSSSGNIIVPEEGMVNTFNDCVWSSETGRENYERALITSTSILTMCKNCFIHCPDDGGISSLEIGNTFIAIGCTFDGPINYGLNSEPTNLASNRYEALYYGCTFLPNARINATDWPNDTLSKLYINLYGCKFHPRQAGGARIKVKAGHLIIRDCWMYDNDATITVHSDFISVIEDVTFTELLIQVNNMSYEAATLGNTFVSVDTGNTLGAGFVCQIIDINRILSPTIHDGNLTVEEFTPTFTAVP